MSSALVNYPSSRDLIFPFGGAPFKIVNSPDLCVPFNSSQNWWMYCTSRLSIKICTPFVGLMHFSWHIGFRSLLFPPGGLCFAGGKLALETFSGWNYGIVVWKLMLMHSGQWSATPSTFNRWSYWQPPPGGYNNFLYGFIGFIGFIGLTHFVLSASATHYCMLLHPKST